LKVLEFLSPEIVVQVWRCPEIHTLSWNFYILSQNLMSSSLCQIIISGSDWRKHAEKTTKWYRKSIWSVGLVNSFRNLLVAGGRIKSNQTNYFIVRLKVDQRAGQLSLLH